MNWQNEENFSAVGAETQAENRLPGQNVDQRRTAGAAAPAAKGPGSADYRLTLRMTAPKRRLRKADRLRLKSEFDAVRRTGRKQTGRGLVAVIAPAVDGKLKCAVICGRKYSLLAVRRNRVRRLLWESFRLLKPELSRPIHLILIPRRPLLGWKRPQATRELAALLAREQLLTAELAAAPPEC